MRYLRIWAAVMVIVMGLGLASCGGGGVQVESDSYTTTLGQELKDLEEAYQKGIITEKQYNNAKKKLIEQRTNK